MQNMFTKKFISVILNFACISVYLFLLVIFSANFVYASSTDGTIDSTNRYAYMEAGSWVDLGSTQGNVHVTDSALSGYAWSSEFGWISLNCSNTSSCSSGVDYKVANDNEGVLSGYSWSETAGWIDWKPTNGGVTINSSGIFSGRAWGDQVGWITFNCSADSSCGSVDYTITTDWRPLSSRSVASPVTDSSTGSNSSSGSRMFLPTIISIPTEIVSNIIDAIIPEFLKPKKEPIVKITDEIQVSDVTPLAFNGKWRLLPIQTIGDFVFAPLPRSIRALAVKFPSFGKTLSEVGVVRLSDLDKLRSATLSLPGLTERSGISGASLRTGIFASMAGVPLAKLSPSFKKSLPSETVFARTADELIDLNTSILVSDTGDVNQKINTESRQTIRLAIKPESPVTSIKGYLTFRKRNALSKEDEYSNDMLASVISALPVLGKKSDAPIEDKLVLLSFDYGDSDKDGIWTADINSPVVAGEYEIMTIIAYVDPELGMRQVRLVTVVDPEGYVYEKNGSKETRIPDAEVSIYELNSDSGQYEMWSASTYHQENPQTTGLSGTYSFLVPPGTYRIFAVAPGYSPYDGQPFEVQIGGGVHKNIELIPEHGWIKALDWKILLIIIVVLLLAYNFYRDYRRDK